MSMTMNLTFEENACFKCVNLLHTTDHTDLQSAYVPRYLEHETPTIFLN